MAGWVESNPLAEINCAEIASCTQLLTHGPREVRRTPIDALFVNLQLAGICRGEQDGRRCIVRPGTYAVFDTSRPYSLEFSESGNETSWHVLSFRIPRDQWAAGARTSSVTAWTVDSGTGGGNIVGTMMSSLWSQRRHLNHPATSVMERSFADIVFTVTSAASGGSPSTGHEERDTALLLVVRHFIRDSIRFGRVTAESTARDASISTRTLHRLFQKSGTTFADCVREERLQGAMRDLATFPQAHSVSEVAARWGFYDSSHLTRTFRQFVGCTPTEYRRANTPTPGTAILEP